MGHNYELHNMRESEKDSAPLNNMLRPRINLNLRYSKQSLQSAYLLKSVTNSEHELSMFCPFLSCKKEFRHSGNLKTHMRSHVR
jgi:hypothetical protein